MVDLAFRSASRRPDSRSRLLTLPTELLFPGWSFWSFCKRIGLLKGAREFGVENGDDGEDGVYVEGDGSPREARRPLADGRREEGSSVPC